MKIGPFIHIVDIDLFGRTFGVLCGSEEEIEGILGKPTRFYRRDRMSFVKDRWNGVKKGIAVAREEVGGDQLSGLCVRCENDVFVWMPEWKSTVFVHETFHAICKLKDIVGFDDEETEAYLMEYLFHSVCWSLEDPSNPKSSESDAPRVGRRNARKGKVKLERKTR